MKKIPTINAKPEPLFEEVRISKALRETSWNKEFDDLNCPFCGFNNVHIGRAKNLEGQDNYLAPWPGRGDLIIVPMQCESGCSFDFCIGFHKGDVSIFARKPSIFKPLWKVDENERM